MEIGDACDNCPDGRQSRPVEQSTSASGSHVITTMADGARSVFAADVDGDSDTDLLSASWAGDDTIAWYENDGSNPPSFTEHVITTAATVPNPSSRSDVDGDSDTDVLSASSRQHDRLVRERRFEPAVVHGARDHDRGVRSPVRLRGGRGRRLRHGRALGVHTNDDTIAWYENDGSNPPSFTEHVITTAAYGARSVFAADVDGDSDTDVLSASWDLDDDTIAWYENDGSSPPSFTEHVITTAADGACPSSRRTWTATPTPTCSRRPGLR